MKASLSGGLLLFAGLTGSCDAGSDSEEPYRIERDHFGPLTPQTAYDPDTVQRLFPGATVEATRSRLSDVVNGWSEAIAVGLSDGGSITVSGSSGRVFSASSDSPQFVGERNLRVGLSWQTAGFDASSCTPRQTGLSSKTKMVQCSEAIPNIFYVFTVPEFDISNEKPQFENAVLTEIAWQDPVED